MSQKLVKAVARKLGLDNSRYRPGLAPRRAALIDEAGIGTVLDVGASTGQCALQLRRCGYRGNIISFEPLAAAFERLSAAATADPAWTCHQFALGESDTHAQLEVASNLSSSSLLPLLGILREALRDVSHVRLVSSERVRVRSLDSLALQLDTPTLMKIDVQGYESRVLAGAKASLAHVALIECEVSIEPLYASQQGPLDMLNLLNDLGYDLISLDPGLRDNAGRILEFDAMFARRIRNNDRHRSPPG